MKNLLQKIKEMSNKSPNVCKKLCKKYANRLINNPTWE